MANMKQIFIEFQTSNVKKNSFIKYNNTAKTEVFITRTIPKT